VGIDKESARHFSATLQGLRRAVDTDALGLFKRLLCTMPAMLRLGIEPVAADLLSSAGYLEILHGARGQAAQVRVLP
jgi:hypothetical protein